MWRHKWDQDFRNLQNGCHQRVCRPKMYPPCKFYFSTIFCCQYIVFRPILGLFYHIFTPCDVTNGIKISEIYKMDVTNEFVVPKCIHPANFTFLRSSVVKLWCLDPFWALFTPFTPCDVTSGFQISEISKMDVTNEIFVLKCIHPANFISLWYAVVKIIWPFLFGSKPVQLCGVPVWRHS